ncbi:uncharacterized protein BJ212DRAFT_1516066 [Suillus subaureus]|uniref:Uncharacterized protein n=1 Tax=Suillus subaureus TaxID=48587 RepID=A0A9P7E7R5_9AGAM|nr:uncharacterized protein BJ212DRAFT_1516066 [Suillus subaureus]KAG1813669.1 hypothetical protein BJ212DRAFT_1516066 [Suillus subaureus]
MFRYEDKYSGYLSVYPHIATNAMIKIVLDQMVFSENPAQLVQLKFGLDWQKPLILTDTNSAFKVLFPPRRSTYTVIWRHHSGNTGKPQKTGIPYRTGESMPSKMNTQKFKITFPSLHMCFKLYLTCRIKLRNILHPRTHKNKILGFRTRAQRATSLQGTFDAVKFCASRPCGYVFSSGLNPLVLEARPQSTQGFPLPHFAPRLLLPDDAPLSTFGITPASWATSRLPNNLQQIGQHSAEKLLIEEEVLRGGYHLRSRIFFPPIIRDHAAADICHLVKLELSSAAMIVILMITPPFGPLIFIPEQLQSRTLPSPSLSLQAPPKRQFPTASSNKPFDRKLRSRCRDVSMAIGRPYSQMKRLARWAYDAMAGRSTIFATTYIDVLVLIIERLLAEEPHLDGLDSRAWYGYLVPGTWPSITRSGRPEHPSPPSCIAITMGLLPLVPKVRAKIRLKEILAAWVVGPCFDGLLIPRAQANTHVHRRHTLTEIHGT